MHSDVVISLLAVFFVFIFPAMYYFIGEFRAKRVKQKILNKNKPIMFNGKMLPTIKNKSGYNIVDSETLFIVDPSLWAAWMYSKGYSIEELLQQLECKQYVVLDEERRRSIGIVKDAYKLYSCISHFLVMYRRDFIWVNGCLANATNPMDIEKFTKKKNDYMSSYMRGVNEPLFPYPRILGEDAFIDKLIKSKDIGIDYILQDIGITPDILQETTKNPNGTEAQRLGYAGIPGYRDSIMSDKDKNSMGLAVSESLTDRP